MPLFSVVIPNLNGQKLLAGCLESLRKQVLKDFEIIIVDDGSSDDSVSYLKKNYPDVKILELKKNIGFAAAANMGIQRAEGKLIALLNNDTEADSNWLREIYDAAEKDEEVSFFASKVLDFNKRSVVDSCGDGLSWSGRSHGIGKGKNDGAKFSQKKCVFGATAGAAVYKKEMLGKVGLFDEDFFMYLEDVDLSMRAQLLGFKCVFVPSAKIYHIGSATAKKNSPFIFKYVVRNHWFLMRKNFPNSKIFTNFPRIFVSELRFFIAAIRHFFIKEYLWAVVEIIKMNPKMSKKRNKILGSMTASLKELDGVIR